MKKKKEFQKRSTVTSKSGETYNYTLTNCKGVIPFLDADISVSTENKSLVSVKYHHIGRYNATASKHNGKFKCTVADSGQCITKSGAKRKVLKQINEFERTGGFEGDPEANRIKYERTYP